MRIIAGAAKGRHLTSPPPGTRPLTGRVREALFSILADSVTGASVLDLYAGSGSFGLEALSRGAASAVFIEADRATVAVLESNIATTAIGGRAVRSDVGTFLSGSRERFDMVLIDPPYVLADGAVDDILRLVADRLEDGGTVVVHRRAGSGRPASDNLRLSDQRRYGDSELWLYQKEEG
ncbi:MAG: 16S rRNA (guanine(966)-N(2))-methyltransferase RsmD [Acidimicrobiia bacterium]|nr:MAG: 16S rRNA (guanine(966)-N(2))-methyltransferase RsmD [Acidimicrobiia bacterium]